MIYFLLTSLFALILSQSAFAEISIFCSSPEGTDAEYEANAELLLTRSGVATGSARGMAWNGAKGKHIPYVFDRLEFKSTSAGRYSTSESALQKSPPRYSSDDGKFDIGPESVAVVLIYFSKDPMKTRSKKFEGTLFFYQHYFLFDLFADGGIHYGLECRRP